MKKFIFAFSISILIVSTCFSQHSWKQLGGPYGSRISGIYLHPNGTFYATVFTTSVDRYLIRSQDHGDTWQQMQNTPSEFRIYDPARYGVNTSYSSLIFGADGKIIMYVGSNVYLSADDGNSWGLLKDSVKLFLGTGKPDEYFIRSFSDSIYRTTDGGRSWTNAASGNDGLMMGVTYISWVSGDTYLWGSGVSHDNCASFEWNDFFEIHGAIEQIGKLPDGEYVVRSDRHVVVGDLKKKRSFDLPLDVENIGVLGNSIVGLQTINYSYSTSGYKPMLYQLDSKDLSMKLFPAMPPFSYIYPRSMDNFELNTIIRGDMLGNILFANGDGLYKTTDNGESWKEIVVNFQSVSYIQLDEFGRIFSKPYESYDNGDNSGAYNWLRKSEDEGKFWSRISPVGRGYYGMIGPGFDGGIITTSHDSTCSTGMDIWYYKELETGGWTKLSRLVYAPPGGSGGGPVSADFILLDSQEHIYLGGGYLWKSEDKGQNWDYLKQPCPVDAERGAFSPSWKLFVGGQGNKVAATGDGGATWDLLTRLPVAPDVIVQTILAPKDRLLYIATNKYGILRSTDEGTSWTKFSGLWGDTVTCLAYTNDGTLFIGTQSSGLFSTDLDGKNTVKEHLQLPTDHIITLFADKGKDVYVGAESSPIWKLNGTSSGVASKGVETSDYSAEMVISGGSEMLRINSNKPLKVNITLFDALGKAYRTLQSKSFSTGSYLIPFDMNGFPTGAYFVQITDGTFSQIVRFIH